MRAVVRHWHAYRVAELRGPDGEPLDLEEPTVPGGGRRIVPRRPSHLATPVVRPLSAPARLAAPAPASEPAPTPRRLTAPGDAAPTDYLGRKITVDATNVATDAEVIAAIAAALAELPSGVTLAQVQGAIATAADTDAEREQFVPTRLSDPALRAALGRVGTADSPVAEASIPRWFTAPWAPGVGPYRAEPDTTWLPPAFATEDDVLKAGGRLAYTWTNYYAPATAKAQLVPGPFGTVPAFTGNAQGAYAVFPLDGILDSYSFTIEFWLRSVGADFTAQPFSTDYSFLSFDSTGGMGEGLRVYRSGSGTLAAHLIGTANGEDNFAAALTIAPGDIPADTWTAVSVTYDGITLRLTLGADAKSATNSGIPTLGALGSADVHYGGLLINPGTGGLNVDDPATPAAAWQVTAPHVRRYPRNPGVSTVAAYPGALVDATVPGAPWRPELTGLFSQYNGWENITADSSTAVRDKAIAGSATVPLVRIDHVFDKVAITDHGAGASPRYSYDWSAIDEPMDAWVAANPDVRFVATLGYTPPLLGASPATPPADNALFAQMCSDAVAHWLTKGYRLAALPLWNEPSFPWFWSGNQAQFQTMWTTVAQRLATDYGSNPNVPKLGTPDDNGPNSYQPGVLTAAQAAGLTVGSYHFHNYTGSVRWLRADIAFVKATLAAAGMPGVGVWVTEWNDSLSALNEVYNGPATSLSTRTPDRVHRLRHAAFTLAAVREFAAAGAAGAAFTRLTILGDAFGGVERSLGAFTADDPPRPLPAHAALSALWKLRGASVPVSVTDPALRAVATWDATGRVLTTVLGSYAPVRTKSARKVALQWRGLPAGALNWKMWRFAEPDVADGRLRLVGQGDRTNLPLGVDLDGVGLYSIQITTAAALPAFTATTPAGLRMDFRASSLSALADGAAVASWPDSGPAGQPLAQPTVGKRPTKVTVTGRPAVRFDPAGSQTLSADYTSDPLGTGPYTVAALVYNDNSDGVFSQMRDPGDDDPIKAYFRGYNLHLLQRNDAGQLIAPSSPGYKRWEWEVVAMVWDGATVTLRLNGRPVTIVGHTGTITTKRLWLGSNADSDFLAGDIDRWMAWDRVLDLPILRNVERALAADRNVQIVDQS